MSKLGSLSAAPSVEFNGFATRLRDATKAVHHEAERTGFIADLIRGRATLAGYATFLRNLVPVYAALETALDACMATAVLSTFAQPTLRRLPSLLGDLDAIEPICGSTFDAMLPEAQAYARAIEAAADEDGAGLVAHAYARYLGDLSGGQILKPILVRSLALDPGMLRFYDFPAIVDPEVAKAGMREALDSIPASGSVADRIVNEAIAAFRHNIDLSVAVSRRLHAPAA